VRECYFSTGDAFDEMFTVQKPMDVGGMVKTQWVDRDMFERCCAQAGFTKNAGLVFDLLKDGDDFLTRPCFMFRMGISREEYQIPGYPPLKDSEKPSNLLSGSGKPPKPSGKSETLKKVTCHRQEDECSTFDNLSSASTTDTCTPKESPRKSNSLQDGPSTTDTCTPVTAAKWAAAKWALKKSTTDTCTGKESPRKFNSLQDGPSTTDTCTTVNAAKWAHLWRTPEERSGDTPGMERPTAPQSPTKAPAVSGVTDASSLSPQMTLPSLRKKVTEGPLTRFGRLATSHKKSPAVSPAVRRYFKNL